MWSVKDGRNWCLTKKKRDAVHPPDDDSAEELFSTRHADGQLERFPSSKWTYNDLKELKIIYKDEDSIESIFEELQKTYSSKRTASVSQINKRVELYRKITIEDLTFTFDLEI